MTFARHALQIPEANSLPEQLAVHSQSGMATEGGGQLRTTLIISNIPTSYNREEFVEEVCRLGCRNLFDFVFLSPGKKNMINRGFAFVNGVNSLAAQKCANILSGHIWQRHQNAEMKVAVVCYASIQGLQANLRTRRASAAVKQAKVWAKQHRAVNVPLPNFHLQLYESRPAPSRGSLTNMV